MGGRVMGDALAGGVDRVHRSSQRDRLVIPTKAGDDVAE